MADPSILLGLSATRTLTAVGSSVRITASLSPPDGRIAWSGSLGAAANDGPPSGPVLETKFAAGTHVVVATSDLNTMSITIEVGGVRIASPPSGHRFLIPSSGHSPALRFVAAFDGASPTSALEWWATLVRPSDEETCPGSPGEDHEQTIRATIAPTEPFEPSYGPVARGGFLGVSVDASFGPDRHSAFVPARVEGTNPARSAVRAALPHDTLRRIACVESGQRQFDADPDGGESVCPLYRRDGSGHVGVLQILPASLDEVWDWRRNVALGTARFAAIVEDARAYPGAVGASPAFRALVDARNALRAAEGRPTLEIDVPPFSSGDFGVDLQQLELDAIRGWDGWHGTDRFGLPLHEWRIAVETTSGVEVPRLSGIDESSRRAFAVWERVPAADRPAAPGRPDFVAAVVAASPTCGAGGGDDAAVEACAGVKIRVHPSDTKTHEIASKLGATGKQHFVTVKGTGDVILVAELDPDTPERREQLRWKAKGAKLESPAIGDDRRSVKITRDRSEGKKVVLELFAGNERCTRVLVWIVWAKLKARTKGGTDTIGRDPLGVFSGDDVREIDSDGRSLYRPHAGIEWIATIEPKAIITDKDRPAIEDQPRVAPLRFPSGVPGHVAPDGGVLRDATESLFRGWDLSRQERQKMFEGNLQVVPPRPIVQTQHEGFPTDDVEGDDDLQPGDEDDNPYPQTGPRPEPAGKGKVGTLRSSDQPEWPLHDGRDPANRTEAENGEVFRVRWHFRDFVRVQLGDVWYRSSDYGKWRWHFFARMRNGRWNLEPGKQDLLELNHAGW